MGRSEGRLPERELRRRLRVLRWVRFPMVPTGMLPEREAAGRRMAVTSWLLLSHWMPDHWQGDWWVVFQRRVRPPTEDRRDKRAALSEVRSEFPAGRERKRWNMNRSIFR